MKRIIFYFYLSSYCASYSLFASPRLTIDISNPEFRKLITAVPKLVGDSKQADSSSTLLEFTHSELRNLLEFTGLFYILKEVAHKGISSSDLSPTNRKQWQAVGTESLITSKFETLSNGFKLTLKATDIKLGTETLSKSYYISLGNKENIRYALKKFVDALLTQYTGRPGIFASQIVFIGRRNFKDPKQVFTCDIDGTNLRQLTHSPAVHLTPSWHPNGKGILFTSYENRNPDLYYYDLVTNIHRSVAHDSGINSGGVFSPSGDFIAYTGSVRGNAEIYLTTLRGMSTRKLLLSGHGIDVDPAFSPDGNWLAFVSGRYANPHIFRARLQQDPKSGLYRITEEKRLTYAGWYNANPAWSPNSQKIAFAGYDRDIDRFDIFLMNHDGSLLERLTLKSGDNESPSWSPNGQLIIFQSNRKGTQDIKDRSQLHIMNKDGSDQRVIPIEGLYDAQSPKWGPYQKELIFAKGFSG